MRLGRGFSTPHGTPRRRHSSKKVAQKRAVAVPLRTRSASTTLSPGKPNMHTSDRTGPGQLVSGLPRSRARVQDLHSGANHAARINPDRSQPMKRLCIRRVERSRRPSWSRSTSNAGVVPSFWTVAKLARDVQTPRRSPRTRPCQSSSQPQVSTAEDLF